MGFLVKLLWLDLEVLWFDLKLLCFDLKILCVFESSFLFVSISFLG